MPWCLKEGIRSHQYTSVMFKCLDFWLLLRLIKYQQLVMLNNKLLGSQECGWYDMPEDLLFLQAIHFQSFAINPLDKTNRSDELSKDWECWQWRMYISSYHHVFVRSFWKSTNGNFPLALQGRTRTSSSKAKLMKRGGKDGCSHETTWRIC